MAQLSEKRLEALALATVGALKKKGGVTVRDEGAAVHAVAARLRAAWGADPELDRAARARIASLSREVPEGSREWEVLYRQYREELSRRR